MRSLIDPVWLLLIVLTVAIFVKFNDAKINHTVKLLARVSISTLLLLSTGVATLIFDQILATETSSKTDWSPEYIFVLGGGYELGANVAQDFLGTESIRRVNAASALWVEYSQAKVVFSGGQPGTEGSRKSNRHGELAAAQARMLGLDQARIVIESRSMNTRQHPVEALKLAGVGTDTSIAIITSDFHLRRALGEFKKYFTDVSAFGTNDSTNDLSRLSFVPLATHLDENVYRIKEFVGIFIFLTYEYVSNM